MLSLSPDGRYLLLPALTTAHSHAFQRAMRGAAQRPRTSAAAAADDFWSWRGAMYRAASALDPESIERISRVAFRELRRAGVRTVGEFHYVHHQPDGTPYDDRTVHERRRHRAPRRSEGLRIALLRVAYHRAGPGRPAEPGQRRFCDAVGRRRPPRRRRVACKVQGRSGRARRRRSALGARRAPAVDRRARRATRLATGCPFHMHVAEQPREIDECIAETGKRPVELLADLGVLSDRFVAVHATHLAPHEAGSSARRARSRASARRPSAISATGCPISARCARPARASAPASTATSSPIPSPTCARSRRSSACAPAARHVRRRRRADRPPRSSGARARSRAPLACGFADAGGHAPDPRAITRRSRSSRSALLLDAVVFGGSSAMVESVSA